MARPTKFNDKRAARIIELVREGNFKTTAARGAGINPATLDRWIKDGVAGKNKQLREFCAALEVAEAEAEIEGLKEWKVARKTSPEAIKEYLRRRFKHWNVPDKAEIKQEIKEDTDVIDARVSEYFAERKKRGIILRDDTEESIHTDNTDTETSGTPKE
jgi:hypothetical protein